MKQSEQFSRLPGGALVSQRLDDLCQGRATIAALLLEVAHRRLARAGLLPEAGEPGPRAAELMLYRQLHAELLFLASTKLKSGLAKSSAISSLAGSLAPKPIWLANSCVTSAVTIKRQTH
jgi:hypothetical protein